MKKILSIVLFSFSTSLFAVMAYLGEITFTQANGSTFNGYLKGDEWFSWVEGGQGEIIIYNRKSRNYDLAVIKKINGVAELKSSGVRFSPSYYASSPSTSARANTIKNSLSAIWQRKRNEALE
ncbi:hypothetical protein CRYPD_387 [uncultured Candidatus Thioglobus sp.]|nr:hypothetical protein CRYPD_387 [uncultured Candidatus Thioglobus sp.]